MGTNQSAFINWCKKYGLACKIFGEKSGIPSVLVVGVDILNMLSVTFCNKDTEQTFCQQLG